MSFQYHRTLHKQAPLVSLLFLTSRCNFASCIYCFAENRGEFTDLPLETWKNIILDLKKRGCKLIFLMGGEPLLYQGFDEIVDFVKSQGLMCHVITNGSLVPKFIDTLMMVDLVEVSIDGLENGNDANRGLGTFRLIDMALNSLKENNVPFRLSCVLTKNNISDIKPLLDYSSKFNVYIGFTIPAEPKNQECKLLFLSREELIKAYKEIRGLTNFYKITLSKKSIDHILNYPCNFDKIINKDDSFKIHVPKFGRLVEKQVSPNYVYPNECPYGRFIVFIDASGNIYPCTSLWELKDTYTPKNIFKDGIDEALKNAQKVPCWACVCAGSEEWNRASSFRGLVHQIRFALSQ
jgi:MoaA/NifB/PqqE/SkfB family radical SAM enzyme